MESEPKHEGVILNIVINGKRTKARRADITIANFINNVTPSGFGMRIYFCYSNDIPSGLLEG